MICWPSINPETKRQYRWFGPDGQDCEPPAFADIPELPPEWVEALRVEPARNGAEIDPDFAVDVSDVFTEGGMSCRVGRKLGEALSELYGGKCRHDEIRDKVLGLLRQGKNGEPGVSRALKVLCESFVKHVAADRDGGEDEAEAEFKRMVYGTDTDAKEKRFSSGMLKLLANSQYDYKVDDGDAAADPWHEISSETTEEAALEYRIGVRLDTLKVYAEAQRRFDAEERPPLVLPAVKDLVTLLAEPDTSTRYLIDQLAPEGGRVMLSAQYKAGKTTVVGNLLRCLVDGEPFLGAFAIRQPVKHAVLIDTEMSENTIKRWLRDQGITSTKAVADVIALRGKVPTFNLLDESCRQAWAARLRALECDYLILDCLRPVLDALGLDENRDAGKFLVAFDALLADAGITDAAIVQHMGHANERARGDSRLQDWPDAIWRIVRETEEPDSARYFSAYGRDVDVHEGQLSFDPSTRRVTYRTGSRLDAKAEAARGDIIRLLARSKEGLSKNAIENDPALADHARKPIRAGLRKAIEDGFVTVEDGPHRSKIHRINQPCEHCGMPVAGGGARHLSCSK